MRPLNPRHILRTEARPALVFLRTQLRLVQSKPHPCLVRVAFRECGLFLSTSYLYLRYNKPSLYRHSIQQQQQKKKNNKKQKLIMIAWLEQNPRSFHQKLCNNLVFSTSIKKTNYFLIFVSVCNWDDSNKYPKHTFCEEIRIKQSSSYILIIFLQQLIHFDSNIFGTKCCSCNEGHCTYKLFCIIYNCSQTSILPLQF